jgi:hypothetical protein
VHRHLTGATHSDSHRYGGEEDDGVDDESSDDDEEDKEAQRSLHHVELDDTDSIMPKKQAAAIVKRKNWAKLMQERRDVSQIAMLFGAEYGWAVSDGITTDDKGGGILAAYADGSSWHFKERLDISTYGRDRDWFIITSSV